MAGPKNRNSLSTKRISYNMLIQKAAMLNLVSGTDDASFTIELITDCFNAGSKKVEADLDAATEAFKKEFAES